MARCGMEMMAEWGAADVSERSPMLTQRIADGVGDLGVNVLARQLRAPHILSLGMRAAFPRI